MTTYELIELYRTLVKSKGIIEQELMRRLGWIDLYSLGFKIAAIRKYREESKEHISLLEAKQAIEKYFS